MKNVIRDYTEASIWSLDYPFNTRIYLYCEDKDPIPEYGGIIDGWTNYIILYGCINLGTTDDLLIAGNSTLWTLLYINNFPHINNILCSMFPMLQIDLI